MHYNLITALLLAVPIPGGAVQATISPPLGKGGGRGVGPSTLIETHVKMALGEQNHTELIEVAVRPPQLPLARG